MTNIDFVIVSYDCNFWAMASLDALVKSAKLANCNSKFYIVHNRKTDIQVDYFKDYFSDYDNIIHVNAYEGVFKGVDNYHEMYDYKYHNQFTKTEDKPHTFISQYPMVLCWLIKYWLPTGKYMFIDHDCIVNDIFISKLTDKTAQLENKILGLPIHDNQYISATSPMFMVDTEIRKQLIDVPDFAWIKSIVGPVERIKVAQNWRKSKFEKELKLKSFDDCLLNVMRHIMHKDRDFENYITKIDWGYNEHLWDSGKNLNDPDKRKILLKYFRYHLQKEYFIEDVQTETFLFFLMNLKSYNFENEFSYMFDLVKENPDLDSYLYGRFCEKSPFKFH